MMGHGQSATHSRKRAETCFSPVLESSTPGRDFQSDQAKSVIQSLSPTLSCHFLWGPVEGSMLYQTSPVSLSDPVSGLLGIPPTSTVEFVLLCCPLPKDLHVRFFRRVKAAAARTTKQWWSFAIVLILSDLHQSSWALVPLTWMSLMAMGLEASTVLP